MKITANLIKTLLINKYRYKDGLLVSSEVNLIGTDNIADILAVKQSTKEYFEVEIKISKSDLIKDIHKMKHKSYINPSFKGPNKFYYAVPTKLVPVCENYIDEHTLPYGIIELVSKSFTEDTFKVNRMKYHSFKYSDILKVVKRPKKLNTYPISDTQFYYFLQRMASELATSSRKLLEIKLTETIK